SGESGWGMSIAKNDDRLFATLFAYDTNGRPQWLLLQDAKWDAVHEVYHGNLYRPTSAPYGNYDSARFSMGEAVGTGSLSFLGKDDGHFDYTIDGYSGGKTLERYMFAPHGDVRAPRAGMWWGGSGQDGWGVSIQEQGDVMFATWYSYGSDGNVTWLYMPAGRKTGASTYAGPVYRTSGVAWVGTRFDGSKTRASAVGSMELTFKDADHAIMTTVVDGISFSQSLQRFPF
ncbi:MAG TPA: hypothetical protein VM122_11185, partial [Usitatibacter sp.]|nr:hypothetical protein [Usitatibacter sp.]